MTSLDIHILMSKDTPEEWHRQCLTSISEAVKHATYPVEVHLVAGVPGHIGKARQAGYAQGNAEWKVYVDDDDYLLPNACIALAPHLDKDVAAILPRERPLQNGQMHGFTLARHHFQVYRADVPQAFDHTQWPSFGDVAMLHEALRDPRGVLDIEDEVYIHRVYLKSKARTMRRTHRWEIQKAYNIYGTAQ